LLTPLFLRSTVPDRISHPGGESSPRRQDRQVFFLWSSLLLVLVVTLQVEVETDGGLEIDAFPFLHGRKTGPADPAEIGL